MQESDYMNINPWHCEDMDGTMAYKKQAIADLLYSSYR